MYEEAPDLLATEELPTPDMWAGNGRLPTGRDGKDVPQ